MVDYWLEHRWLVERAGTWQLAVEIEELVHGRSRELIANHRARARAPAEIRARDLA
jgi:hypothetical protein